jgi:CHASE3 domain sensor protein
MTERDYVSTPVSDSLGLHSVVTGLADDLAKLRKGDISPADAHARAALAKQIMNGARLYLQAMQTLERRAKQVKGCDLIGGGE